MMRRLRRIATVENRRRPGSRAPVGAAAPRDAGRSQLGNQVRARTVYVECSHTMTDEDLTIIEDAGRRCAVCHTGRRWRDFEVVRPENGEPVVMCAACKARYGEKPPVAVAEPQPEPTPAAAPEPAQKKPARRSRPRQSEDRLKRALRELPPGEHSTGRIAEGRGAQPRQGPQPPARAAGGRRGPPDRQALVGGSPLHRPRGGVRPPPGPDGQPAHRARDAAGLLLGGGEGLELVAGALTRRRSSSRRSSSRALRPRIRVPAAVGRAVRRTAS